MPGQASGYVSPGSGAPIFSTDDAKNAAFVATAQDTSQNNLFTGVYAQQFGGALQTVVDSNTLIPKFDGVTKFSSFSNVAIDGPITAFIASGGSTTGIFAATGGSLMEVISNGDSLDGKTVSSLSLSGDRPLSQDQLVFTAGFTDRSTGLFLAQVPEPSAIFAQHGQNEQPCQRPAGDKRWEHEHRQVCHDPNCHHGPKCAIQDCELATSGWPLQESIHWPNLKSGHFVYFRERMKHHAGNFDEGYRRNVARQNVRSTDAMNWERSRFLACRSTAL